MINIKILVGGKVQSPKLYASRQISYAYNGLKNYSRDLIKQHISRVKSMQKKSH